MLFPGQTGLTDPGETSFAWRRVTIDVNNGFADSTDPNRIALNVTLIDNVLVEEVPEPALLGLLALGGLTLLRRRGPRASAPIQTRG